MRGKPILILGLLLIQQAIYPAHIRAASGQISDAESWIIPEFQFKEGMTPEQAATKERDPMPGFPRFASQINVMEIH